MFILRKHKNSLFLFGNFIFSGLSKQTHLVILCKHHFLYSLLSTEYIRDLGLGREKDSILSGVGVGPTADCFVAECDEEGEEGSCHIERHIPFEVVREMAVPCLFEGVEGGEVSNLSDEGEDDVHCSVLGTEGNESLCFFSFHI